MDLRSRYTGSILGLACGDALGTTLEFSSPGSFEPHLDIKGGGPFQLPPGYWTDDTSMAMCLAESLLEDGGFSHEGQIRRYVEWYRKGLWASTGECFDIGTTTKMALEEYERTGAAVSVVKDPDRAGNGSLMRLAPVALYFHGSPAKAIEMAGESSRTTHAARACVDSCRYYAGLIVGALEGRTRLELCAPGFHPADGAWDRETLNKEVAEVAWGSFRRRSPPFIKGTGHVIRSMEAALWAFFHGESFEDGALKAVNLGHDADTTGAIYGQLAGAYYGVEAIPERWLKLLYRREDLEAVAVRLLEASEKS